MPTLDEVSPLSRLVMKHPREAFISQAVIDRQWRGLNFTAPPEFSRAIEEFEQLLDTIAGAGAEVLLLPSDEGLTLDSIYARDASIVCPHGTILCNMGKPQRASEPDAQRRALEGWG